MTDFEEAKREYAKRRFFFSWERFSVINPNVARGINAFVKLASKNEMVADAIVDFIKILKEPGRWKTGNAEREPQR